MLYKLCRRCKKPITHPATYCSNCLPIKDKKMMDEEYRCERCRKLVIEVQHTKPIQTKIG